MRLLRNRFIARTIACLLLSTFGQSLLAPYYAFALTTGPHQPEYTSYEEPGATDMVNLLTGDFTTSLPVLEVPGPEGGFQVPLTYHGGIGPDQEASWVGLGWTMGVGAITRNVFGFPDDAAGEVNAVTHRDLVGVTNVELNSYLFGKAGWNSLQGNYGALSFLSIVEFGVDHVGIMGVSVSDGDVSFDPVKFAFAVYSIVSLGSSVATKGFEAAMTTALKNEVKGAVVGGLVGIPLRKLASIPLNHAGYLQTQTNRVRMFPFIKLDHTWLDQTRLEEMYGTIYSHSPQLIDAVAIQSDNHVDLSLEINNSSAVLKQFSRSTNNKGAASDIYFNSSANYIDAMSPTILATDKYSVKAPGISGSIKPYRLETGSVSMQREMTQFHNRLSPVPFLNYKVPFVYEGAPSNAYFHHVGGTGTITSPTFHYGYANVLGNSSPTTNTSLKFDFDDTSMGTERIKADVQNNNYKIPQANHIEWLTNETITATTSDFTSGFMDYFTGSQRIDFRNVQSFGSNKSFYSSSPDFTNGVIQLSSAADLDYFVVNQSVPIQIVAYNTEEDFQNSGSGGTEYNSTLTVASKNSTNKTITVTVGGSLLSNITGKFCNIVVTSLNKPKAPGAIGGFSITNATGVTYHFALPIYDYDNYMRVQDPADAGKHSIIEKKEPFANTWLLTGITGPDFVDRGGASNAANGIIDEKDWGYWVKFNYGKWTESYEYRAPFADNTFILDADEASKSYSKGKKQLYYLNSIETRSHVALFLKGVRADNKAKNGTTTLRLEEVVLLNRDHYKKLGMAAPNGFNLALCSGSTGKMWLSSEFYSTSGSHPAQGQFVIKNAVKRIKFTYDYALCNGVPNSTAGGKLTLNRVSILGRYDQKIVPDYKFEYANNYSYNADHWDGWGMYNPSSTQTSRPVSANDAHGAAWTLSKITTPLGSEISINLERDTYSSISGNKIWSSSPVLYSYSSGDPDAITHLLNNKIQLSSSSNLNVGDRVLIDGTIQYKCHSTGAQLLIDYENDAIVESIAGNVVEFEGSNYPAIACLSSQIVIESNTGVVKKLETRKGGDIRVHSIITDNGFGQQNKIRYLYNDTDGSSCGVVSQEPDYVKSYHYPFYDLPGYPLTPVMYRKVTALTGKLSTDTDFHTKQVYEFETPDQTMYTFQKVLHKVKAPIYYKHVELPSGINDLDVYYEDYLTEVQHTLNDYTSKIGSLKSIKTYDKTTLRSTVDMVYTSSLTNPGGLVKHQGVYSEGTLMFDQISDLQQPSIDETRDRRYYKTNKTTILYHPYVLKETVVSKDGFTNKTKNDAWDFISGQVLEKTETSPLGVKIQSVSIPAYSHYPDMGSKAMNIANKNMLLQEAASYSYQLNDNGDRVGLISASAQTWKKDWNNYRVYNGTTQTFTDGDDEPVSFGAWRKEQAYGWKGNYQRMQPDGTQRFSASDQFAFATPLSNPEWQFAGEIGRFDHYGMPLEVKDMNNLFSATRMGYNDNVVIAGAANARFNEIAFSSAEDLYSDKPFFGGEIGLGNGTIKYKHKAPLATSSHTGQAVVALSAGYAFVYKASSLDANKRYRASAWTNHLNGRIYYKLNGGTENLSSAPSSTKLVNGWYRMDLDIPVQSSAFSIEVGVKSTSGEVYFDDFRFQPVESTMTCYVYPSADFEFTDSQPANNLTYVLDNENMYTKFEYTSRGELSKTYQESFNYGVKLISESKDNYRRFHVNQ